MVVTRVQLEQVLQADSRAAYLAARDFTAYRGLMPNVLTLHVSERGPADQVSAWEVVYAGQVVRWTEHDQFDDEHLTIRSRLLESPFWTHFSVDCTFAPEAGATRVRAEIQLQPLRYAEVVGPIARSMIRRNFETLLGRLAERVQRAAEAAPAG
jgi:ribosome-associated toxin RatA of RatAB toxin-antitoxin module